jgi:hypothetical protein
MTVLSNVGTQTDLLIRQGADFLTTLTFTNPDTTPVNLTGCTLAAQLRRTPRAASVMATFALSITNPTGGIATMGLSAATTAALTCGDNATDSLSSYWWDLKLVDSTGKISSPLNGNVQVFREITL